MPKAKEAALKALALDDKIAEAHASLGQIVAYYDYDYATAEKEYRRALELNPNYAVVHQRLAELLSALKRPDEAVNEIRRALDLDPVSVIMNKIYADVLVSARRYDEALEQYRKAVELDPNFPATHYFVGRAYEAKGLYDQAVAEYELTALGTLSQEAHKRMREAYSKSGWHGYLQATLQQMIETQRINLPPFVVASVYARLGRNDEAMAWLEKGYEERDLRMPLIGVSFEFDGLRSDPRFKDLVRRVRLPE
jgi:tetratricopeptide (TPR) repeat protein